MRGGKAVEGEESNDGSGGHPGKSKSRGSRWDKQKSAAKQEAQAGPVASAPDTDPATAGAQNDAAGEPVEPKTTPDVDSQKLNPRPLNPTEAGPSQKLNPRPLNPMETGPSQKLNPRPLNPMETGPSQKLNPRPFNPMEAGPSRDQVDAGFQKNPRFENIAPRPVQLGFEILEKRPITMTDGTVRTYYALPPSEQQHPFPSGPFDARNAEFERFYAASPAAPPLQSGGSGPDNSRERPGDEGSIPRVPRDYQYGKVAGMGPPSSMEVPSERDYVPAGGPGLDGSAREGYPYRNLGPEGGGPMEGSRNPMSPRGYQVSPHSAPMRMAPREPFYGSGDNLLKRKYAEEEAASDSMQRGVMDDRDYMRRAREMEIEEYRRREQGTSDFSRDKYLEEEIIRSRGYLMSRQPSHYDSPHGVPASRFTSNNKDPMRGPSAESWVSPSHQGPGGSLSRGRQDLQYNNALGRDREEGHDYQRPFKHQRLNDAHDSQNRVGSERHAIDDAFKSDREPMQQPGLVENNQELKQQVQRAYLRFVKLLNENAGQRRRYEEDGKGGPVQCAVCSSQSMDFVDTHSLIMHAYNAPNPMLRSEHLGLYKALCVLMGWSYASPPDNEKSYQSFSAPEAMENTQDLILWPPLVIIQNASTGKRKDGLLEGIGNREMDAQLEELGFTGGKSKAVYGRGGHQGTIIVKFSPSSAGLQEAEQLIKYFESKNHGRKDWLRVQSSTVNQENGEENPELVETDEKTKLKKRVLYGYLAIAGDLEKLDVDTRKKALVKSKKDIDATADGQV
eukprot:PITA_13383